LEGILLPYRPDSLSGREKVQIVIPKHDHSSRTQGFDPSQYSKGFGPSIDKVPDKPQRVLEWIKAEFVYETL
jgi:hypothetical protein